MLSDSYVVFVSVTLRSDTDTEGDGYSESGKEFHRRMCCLLLDVESWMVGRSLYMSCSTSMINIQPSIQIRSSTHVVSLDLLT